MENGLKQEIREEIIKAAQKNNVSKVILFGYRARGDYEEPFEDLLCI